MSAPVIELAGVSKSFQVPDERRDTVREHVLGLVRRRQFRALQVLSSIDLRVEPGEAVGIMGRNGCGKSTLLKIICGIYRPDAGHLSIRAPVTPILELGVGWNPELDAIDNVYLIGSIMGRSLREIRGSLDAMLEFAGLAEFARMKLKHYSSGMSARLAYAVAFWAVSDILVLDEIFAVGDASFRARCEARYRELRAAGRTVLLVSHDPRIISRHCDRTVVLESGRIVADGAAAAVASAYDTKLSTTAPQQLSPIACAATAQADRA